MYTANNSQCYVITYADGFTQTMTAPYSHVAYAATDTAHMRRTAWVSIRPASDYKPMPMEAVAELAGMLDTV